jgi:hypothetical protein
VSVPCNINGENHADYKLIDNWGFVILFMIAYD